MTFVIYLPFLKLFICIKKHMNKPGLRAAMLMTVFVWAGMLLGISFLEAPLKFQAPSVTLAIGLGIGKLVFGTLNKIEIFYCISLVIMGLLVKPSSMFRYMLGFIAVILIVQTFWLLPVLDNRAEIIISGGVPSEKSPHFIYVAAEAVKLICLITAAFRLFSESVKTNLKP